MKRNLLFTLLLCLPLLAICQMNTSLDVIGSVDYSYRRLAANTDDPSIPTGILINSYNNIEIPKLNWHLGVNINKKVGSRWYVKSGLRLASMGYKDKKVSGLTWPSQHNGNGGFDPNATPGILEYQLSRDFWYLEIPLMCRYQFGNKKLHAFVEAGFSPSIFLTMRNVTVKNGKKTVDYRQDFSTSSIDKFQLLGNISFGINYSINERYQVFGQPIFRYSLTPVADTPLTRYLFSGGVEMGVRRRI